MEDIQTTTLDGCRTQFGLNFIKPGIIEKKFGKHFSKVFDLRQKGNYGDLFDYNKVTIEPLIVLTDEFIRYAIM
jgi:uncharacterized protein (UPF0332 family)